jgi:hypothetical protein
MKQPFVPGSKGEQYRVTKSALRGAPSMGGGPIRWLFDIPLTFDDRDIEENFGSLLGPADLIL